MNIEEFSKSVHCKPLTPIEKELIKLLDKPEEELRKIIKMNMEGRRR